MKKLIAIVLVAAFSATKMSAGVDPVTAAAVTAQTISLNNQYNKRKKLQEEIIATQAAVTLAMTRVHDVEKKMLDYLSNVSGAVGNLYQIKRAGELIIEIGTNSVELANIAKKNIKNTALSLAISNELTKIYTDAATLVPFMSQLVTSGTIGTGKDEHKVNLLNSAERYYIASTILSKLQDMEMRVRFLGYSIKYFNLKSFFFSLDRDTWCTYVNSRWIMEDVIRKWNRTWGK